MARSGLLPVEAIELATLLGLRKTVSMGIFYKQESSSAGVVSGERRVTLYPTLMRVQTMLSIFVEREDTLFLGQRLTKQNTFISIKIQHISLLQKIINRRMLIDREHYLELLRKAESLMEENTVLRRENQILSMVLEEQKCANYELQNKFVEMKEYFVVMNERLTNQNDSLHCDLKGHTTALSQKQREYLEQKFKVLETSSFQKYKLLQMRNTVNRIQNHELQEFCEKVKKMYKNSNKQDKQPSLKDVIKWIKEIRPKKQNKDTVVPQGKKQNETKSSWKNSSAK